MRVIPLSDWIVVKVAPFDKRSSILELPGQNESAVRKGVVVAVGPGRPLTETAGTKPVDVKEGESIVFLRWHSEHRPGKANVEALAKWSAELGEDLCMIRESDVLFAYTGDVKVDV